MKEIPLSLAHYKAIADEQGAEAAVEAIRAKIQENAPDYPIELTLRGPNPDGDRVASLSFVNAASWKANPNKFRVNLLTSGFARDDGRSIVNLFWALTHPEVPVLVKPEDAPEDTPIHEDEIEVVGLIVGSHAHPALFVRIER